LAREQFPYSKDDAPLAFLFMTFERVKNSVHPTQKPIKVLSHLVKLATNPEDLVFDPFMGVGSSGVAALQLISNPFRECIMEAWRKE